MHDRRIYHQAAIFRLRQGDALERSVPVAGIRAAQSSQGNMRERLRHSIGTPYVVGETNQHTGQCLIDSAATNNQMFYLLQFLPLFRHLQGIIYLHRHHRRKIHWLRHHGQRVSAGLHHNQSQAPGLSPHHHHLTSDIIKRHTQQRCITLFQSQELTGDTCRSLHTSFLHVHRLWLTRRTTGMNQHHRAIAMPLG